MIATKGGTFEIVVGNSITRDQGNFKITKRDQPGRGDPAGAFAGTYNCGAGYTGNFSVAAGLARRSRHPDREHLLGRRDRTRAASTGCTWGPITYTPATIVIATKGGTFEIVVGNSITRDQGNFKITKP